MPADRPGWPGRRHGCGTAQLGEHEPHHKPDTAEDTGEHPRVREPGRAAAAQLDGIGDSGEAPTDDEADETAGYRGDLVGAEGEAASVGREGIRQNRGGVGEQHRPACPLHETPDDEPDGAGRAGERVEGECDGADGEHDEAEVVDLDPPVNVAEAAEAHDEHYRWVAVEQTRARRTAGGWSKGHGPRSNNSCLLSSTYIPHCPTASNRHS